MTRKAQLNPFLGQNVRITFTNGVVVEGVLGYTSAFSKEFNWRKPGYYTIRDVDFKVSHVQSVSVIESDIGAKKETFLHMMKVFPLEVIQLALAYAQNMTIYGVDVTEKLETATQQAAEAHTAYRKGFDDGRAYAQDMTGFAHFLIEHVDPDVIQKCREEYDKGREMSSTILSKM